MIGAGGSGIGGPPLGGPPPGGPPPGGPLPRCGYPINGPAGGPQGSPPYMYLLASGGPPPGGRNHPKGTRVCSVPPVLGGSG
jgi:hypothetical protein